LRTFIDKNEAHWVRPDMELQINETQVYMVQIRYRQDPFEAKITRSNKGLEIAFEQPQKSVAKGQFAAWFLGDELIGSGVMS
jgi:tRNA-uridine 2-sulfurtransferase